MRLDDEQNISFTVIPASGETRALVELFEAIAHEQGWQPDGELRTHCEQSVYFALTVGGRLAGGLQLVLPDPEGALPCRTVWPELTLGKQPDVGHVAILALRKEFRGRGDLFWFLGVELWRYCCANGIRQLLLEVTPRVLPLYQRLGWPLRIRGELRMHWGEPCYLCSLSVREVAGSLVEKAVRSPVYRRLLAHACCGEDAAADPFLTAGS